MSLPRFRLSFPIWGTVILGLLLSAGVSGTAASHPGRFVWRDAKESGRQDLVLLRRSFHVNTPVDQAVLHLFADSRYHLYLNGTHLGFGPSRFYPRNPAYDSFDLRPHLRPGENVLAIEALSNGTDTFQVPLSRGGVVAWGEVTAGPTRTDLATPGDWRLWAPASFHPETLRFSFAKGPVEVRDFRREPTGWQLPGFDERAWSSPIVVAPQEHWGPLQPRSIPALTDDLRMPLRLMGAYRAQGGENVYRAFVSAPDEDPERYAGSDRYPVLARTHIWSPRDQEVLLGGWLGFYRVNGLAPLEQINAAHNAVRVDRRVALRQGWNSLFFRENTRWGGLDFYLSAPRQAELQFSPHRQLGDRTWLEVLLPGNADQRTQLRERLSGAESAAAVPEDLAGWWIDVAADTPPINPARELAWVLDDSVIEPEAPELPLVVRDSRIIVADMGRTTLGRILVDVDAPSGTTIDLGWSEDLNGRGVPHLLKRPQVNAGARFVTREGAGHYTTFKPYGLRYLILHVQVPAGGTATIRRLGQIEQVYPFAQHGAFACSDPMLERIWELGWRTLQVCAEDSYTDTPFRERGLYAGDMLPQYGITLVTAGDSRLARRSLQLFQDQYRKDLLEGAETHLNDYVLKTLLALEWYAQITSDWSFVAEVLPNYHRYFTHLEDRRQPGGYYRAGRTFIDWIALDKRADLTAYQAVLYGSFRTMERLTGRQGDEALAGTYAARAAALAAVIQRNCWDPAAGAFHDGFNDGSPIAHHFPVSSAYPIVFGATGGAQAATATATMMRDAAQLGTEPRRLRVDTYGSFFLLTALYAQGEAGFAEAFIKRHWSPMIVHGDDTAWENFAPAGDRASGIGTRSHAWSGHPTWFLSTETLGIKLGFSGPFDPRIIRIEPQSESLAWARGWVPHPAGTVSVDWRLHGGKLILHVVAPEGPEVKVAPRGRLATFPLELQLERRAPQATP